MKLFAGASGYSFKEWKGTFYPADMKPEGMLAFYSARLPTVEINNTFYRMPKVEMLEHWARTAPPAFRFAISCCALWLYLKLSLNTATLVSSIFTLPQAPARPQHPLPCLS